MTKRALCLDMDDIMYPFMQTLVPFYNEQYEANYTLDDYFDFDFDKVWGGTKEEAWSRVDKCFKKLDELDTHPVPLTGADVAIKELSERYRLFVVTARGDEFHERTHKWIDTHFNGVFEGVFLCNQYVHDGRDSIRSKGSVVEELDAVGLVDDSASHITEIAELGRTGILFGDYAWNRDRSIPANAHRVANWNEVTALLMGDRV